MERQRSGNGGSSAWHHAGLIPAAAGPGLAVAVAVLYAVMFTGDLYGDAFVYLAAGERLNVGHDLYALQPGDRPVPLSPPFWTVPFLSPPAVGVLWRPLAAIPGALGVALWVAAAWCAILGGVIWLWRQNRLATSLGVALLAIPIGMELGLGNINAFLLAGTIAMWALRDRPASGMILGVMIGVKIWPAFLGVWLVGQRSWRTIAYAATAAVVVTLIGIAGSSVDAGFTYLGIGSGVHLSAFSPSWLLGIPWLWLATAVVGSACTLLFRSRPGLSFSVAVLTMVLGAPVVNPNTYMILLAALAPIGEWRARSASHAPRRATDKPGGPDIADGSVVS